MNTQLKEWLHAQLFAPLFAPLGPAPAHPSHRRRGVALILALLFIVLLTVLVVEFSYETQVEASIATNSTGDFEATLAAKSAVAQGMSMLWEHLVTIQNGELDTPPGVIPNNNNSQPLNPGAGEPYDSKYDQWAIGVPFEPINDATMRVTISDEYGKINLNALLVPGQNGEPTERLELVETLRAFFQNRVSGGENTGKKSSFDPVDAILDWLDYGESDNERNDGAEDDYYMGLENPYHCKNAPMDSIEELLLIKGITPELYFGDEENNQLPLSAYLTVQGHWAGAINVNTAQIEVLEAAQLGYTANGGSRDINLNQFNEIMSRVTAGETIYSMGELQALNKGRKTKNPNDPKPVDANGDGIDDNTGKPIKKEDEGGPGGPNLPPAFIISSNCFRILGDGMQGDALVRIEAYVWRNSPLTNPEDLKALLPRQLRDEWTPPTENFRILDWKVIR